MGKSRQNIGKSPNNRKVNAASHCKATRAYWNSVLRVNVSIDQDHNFRGPLMSKKGIIGPLLELLCSKMRCVHTSSFITQ